MTWFCAVSTARTAPVAALLALAAAAGCGRPAESAAADRYSITLTGPPADTLDDSGVTGRLILMFITEQGRPWDRRSPLQGPFLDHPQPIASIAVEHWDGSTPIELTDDNAALFAGPLDDFAGPIRVQAQLHVNVLAPRLMPGPGSSYSEPVVVNARPQHADHITIELNRPIRAPDVFTARPNLHLIERRSAMLSEHLGRDVMHRAAVALPADYDQHESWPVVYVIPDRNERLFSAAEYADMLNTRGIEQIAPRAVFIMLDPHTAYGHHGFADTELHGPRATALVQELIPHLESQYKLATTPQARLLSGFALGGWSAIQLQLRHPDAFGGCWATAPTPIDFHAMQSVDLYDDADAFRNEDHEPRYAYRTPGRAIDQMIASTTIAQMIRFERAIDPQGRSGGLWQTVTAICSPVDPETGQPQPVVDANTGKINRSVAEHWRQYDLTRLIETQWERCGDAATNRLHIFAARLDSYYFHRAVERFRRVLEQNVGDAPMGSTIQLIEGATHENLQRYVFDDINQQMRDHLEQHDLDR